jgi:hypothetical protein
VPTTYVVLLIIIYDGCIDDKRVVCNVASALLGLGTYGMNDGRGGSSQGQYISIQETGGGGGGTLATPR